MITFYSTHCPQCKVLQMKLEKKNIDFVECDDTEKMKSLGLKAAPALEINGEILGFADAVKWVNAQ